jgi:ribosomal protein L29
MKRRNLDEMKNKSAVELRQFAQDSREKVRTMKLDLMAGKVKNVDDLRVLRKDIARALTIATQKDNAK